MSMGSRIRAARDAKGLTIEALAKTVGITPAQLSRIETGARSTTSHVLRKIVAELGIETPASQFLSEEDTVVEDETPTEVSP